jgi:hypothetical protein
MAATIPSTEPLQIVAGDYIQWSKALSDYLPVDGWVLSYALINSLAKISITGTTGSDGNHLITIAAATSAAYTAGIYSWQSYVTKASQRVNIGTGDIEIKPNFASLTTLDARSLVKQTLDAINTEILARATGGMTQEYTIGNRSLKKCTAGELITMRDKFTILYNQEVNAEKVRNGMKANNKIYMRF